MMTEMSPHQQAPAIVLRLQGQASEVARLIPPEQLVLGVDLADGTHIDAVTNLMTHLSQRFAAYPEEERNEAMLRVWNFRRLHNEGIDSMVSRFRELRYRAAREGRYLMSIEGWAYTFIRQVHGLEHHMMLLLEPYEYQMATTEEQLQQLLERIRRIGHQQERRVGSVTQMLGNHAFPIFEENG